MATREARKPPAREPVSSGRARAPAAALGLGVIAVACCAELPLLATAAGGLTVGALIGGGAGLLVALALGFATVLLVKARRRRPKGPDRGAGGPVR